MDICYLLFDDFFCIEVVPGYLCFNLFIYEFHVSIADPLPYIWIFL